MIRANILDPSTNRVLGSCTGPRPDGVCAREDEQGHVPCAGLVLDAAVEEKRWALRVPVGSGARQCPLRAFVVEAPDRNRWS